MALTKLCSFDPLNRDGYLMQFDVADPATIKTLVDIQKSTESPMRNLVRSAGAIGADVGL
jgi:hypothetical protein